MSSMHSPLRNPSSRWPRWLALALAPLMACASAPDPSGSPTRELAPVREAEPKTDAERVIELSLRDNRVQEHLRHLSKEIGPRLTGSKNFDRAAEWCLQQFRSWGLDARLEKWGEFEVAFDRGVQRGRLVAPEVQELDFHTRSWTRGTQGAQRGKLVLEPADVEGVAALAGQLADAWVLRRKERTNAKTRKALDEALEKDGGHGTIARSMAGERLIMSGDHRVDLAKLPKLVRIDLRADHFDGLLARLERGETVEVEFESENLFTPGPVPCFNVIAELRGREFPEQVVLIGGHLDTWDGAEGAQDNGTGVSTAMEAARLLAACGIQPRRTIRFVLFGGEEQGLYGSQQYVKDHADELAQHSVALIHDGGGTVLRGLAPTYRMLADFEQVFAPLAGTDARFPFELHEVDALVNSGDSDHAPFISAGVPGFFWEQTEEGYEHVHHTQYDKFETVDPDQQMQSARVVAVAALGFANLPNLIDREDMRPIQRRRMGVELDGLKVTSLTPKGVAEKSGVLVGDVLVALDGATLATRTEMTNALQRGASQKKLRVQRGAETVELTLDYTGLPGEDERAERARRRAEWEAKRASGK